MAHDERRRIGDHAVVLGASVAGLAAAAALAHRFDTVTIVERDPIPPVGEGRRSVPQGRHAHLLLPAGLVALGELLPGIESDLVEHGAHVIPASEFRFNIGVGRLALRNDRLAITGATRPLLEGVIRARVAALPGVTLDACRSVAGLTATEDRRRITGVRIASGSHTAGETLRADLVVDATGRRSDSPRWLEELGYDAPAEERMPVGVHYSTRLFRRHPTDLEGCRHVAIANAAR